MENNKADSTQRQNLSPAEWENVSIALRSLSHDVNKTREAADAPSTGNPK